jgi:hypothetical protein
MPVEDIHSNAGFRTAVGNQQFRFQADTSQHCIPKTDIDCIPVRPYQSINQIIHFFFEKAGFPSRGQ